jgi:hypothetical protein
MDYEKTLSFFYIYLKLKLLMKFIKKYNESKSHDFIDKEYLDDILIEFSDLGLNYTIKMDQ